MYLVYLLSMLHIPKVSFTFISILILQPNVLRRVNPWGHCTGWVMRDIYDQFKVLIVLKTRSTVYKGWKSEDIPQVFVIFNICKYILIASKIRTVFLEYSYTSTSFPWRCHTHLRVLVKIHALRSYYRREKGDV